MLVSSLACSSTLKMEESLLSKTSCDFQWTSQYYIPEDRTLQYYTICAFVTVMSNTEEITVLQNYLHKNYDFNIGRGDKVSKLRAQVEDVKQIMLDNVEKVIGCGERLDDLLSKTEDLESHGTVFRQGARDIRVKMRCKNLRMWLVIGGLLTVVLTVTVLSACGVIHW